MTTDAEHEAAAQDLLVMMDAILSDALRLSPEAHPGIFRQRHDLVRRFTLLLQDHAELAYERGRKQTIDHLNKWLKDNHR